MLTSLRNVEVRATRAVKSDISIESEFGWPSHPIMMCVRCKYAASCVCDAYARRVRMRAAGRRESS